MRAWFIQNADRDIPHLESKPAIEGAWLQLVGTRLEDADRAIRKLCAQGELTKVRKGVYRYDSIKAHARYELDFSEFTKAAALERDGFCCVQCGAKADARNELHVVPITRFEHGGEAVISNARSLCSMHTLVYRISEGGGRFSKSEVRRLLEFFRPEGKFPLVSSSSFAEDLLRSLESNTENSRVAWKDII